MWYSMNRSKTVPAKQVLKWSELWNPSSWDVPQYSSAIVIFEGNEKSSALPSAYVQRIELMANCILTSVEISIPAEIVELTRRQMRPTCKSACIVSVMAKIVK